MASFIQVIQRILHLVLVFSMGILIWNVLHLTKRRTYQQYRKDFPVKLINTKHDMITAQNITTATVSRVTSKHQPVSLNNSAKSPIHSKGLWSEFRYPLDVDMVELVRKLKSNLPVEHKPLFVYHYKFIHHRIDKCVDGSPFFIFLIKSAVRNEKNRAAIRETWSHSNLMEKYNGVRLFLLGTSDTQMKQSSVEEENKLHKDMIIMSFRDNYYNNTLKTIGAIHWTVKHCNCSKFVVFVDDDMLVSTVRLIKFLKHDVTLSTFFGGFIATHHTVRNNKSKWYVSHEDYRYGVYPPMPSGGFMIMSRNFVTDLHFAAQYTKKFILDDCYLGILAYKLRVKPVYIRSV